jgi:hypothetical protein
MIPIQFQNDRLLIRWDNFSAGPAYDLFMKAKRLPEYQILLDDDGLAAGVSAPARFAPMLGVNKPAGERDGLPLSSFLFDDQRAIVTMALESQRFACWSDCGLGKTLVEFEFARQVCARTGGRVLIVTLNDVVPQMLAMAREFYGDTLPIVRLNSREAMKVWCAGAEMDLGPKIAITNYEKFNHKGESEQVISELRMLAGLICDESSKLKAGGGKQKWAIIKSARGIQYKLSCTATPAPNDWMEFASQASFLEKLRDQNEILWTYFVRDNTTHRWTIKPHARQAFFEFMAGWSIYVRDPRRFGWRMNVPRPPEPVLFRHTIPATEEQRQFVMDFNAMQPPPAGDNSGTPSMFAGAYNAIASNKLSQAAKGFIYKTEGKRRIAVPVQSLKPGFVAGLIHQEAVIEGLQVLVWTEYDEETAIIARTLKHFAPDVRFELLNGKVKAKDRAGIKERFLGGQCQVLITRADMMGYGQNLQCAGSMIFSGWSFSYEDYYQAIRRAYRHGQTKVLRVHLPCISELEGQMLEAIGRKDRQQEQAIREMEGHYIKAMKDMKLTTINPEAA